MGYFEKVFRLCPHLPIDLSENTQYAYVTGFQSYNRQFQLEPISTLK